MTVAGIRQQEDDIAVISDVSVHIGNFTDARRREERPMNRTRSARRRTDGLPRESINYAEREWVTRNEGNCSDNWPICYARIKRRSRSR